MFWKGLNCWHSGVFICSCNRLRGENRRNVVQEKSDHCSKVKERKGVCDNTASVHEGDGNPGDSVQGGSAGRMRAELPLDVAALPCSWLSQLEV